MPEDGVGAEHEYAHLVCAPLIDRDHLPAADEDLALLQ